MLRKILKFFFYTFFVLGAFSIPIFFTPIGEIPLKTLFQVGNIEKTDFKSLRLTENPNQYLVCNSHLCSASFHVESPKFSIPVERLKTLLEKVLSEQKDLEPQQEMNADLYQDLVQRTRLVRYPDVITVQLQELGPNSSTLAIYSRSVYGRSDFGVNKDRIDAWLARLKELADR
ncbi:MAG: DUF1499 domain-containing protein [Sneathiellales bacterium]|nr:DUF1499 domain-containing protein [Sneathiellales bacterium]